eukprot:gene5130-5495_t
MDKETQTDSEMHSVEEYPKVESDKTDGSGNWFSKAGYVAGGSTVGTALGYGAVVAGFAAVGLSPLDPVAGGLFAAIWARVLLLDL